jgi:hypothetical protein
MIVTRFVIQFVGGPSDGLVLSDPHFIVRNKVELPAGPAIVRRDPTRCYELIGNWTAAYLFCGSQRNCECGCPTTELRYRFVGYELIGSHSASDIGRHAAPSRAQALGHWFGNLPARLAKWLLEPIDHPLKTCTEESTGALESGIRLISRSARRSVAHGTSNE